MPRIGAADYIRSVNDMIFISDAPAPADAIFVPGSSQDIHVLHAAELWHAGMAPFIIPSGRFAIGTDRFTGAPGYDTEAAWMRALLLERGVPDDAILCEDRATYTWQNALYSKALTERHGLSVRRAILCCKAHHARRALFYYEAAFPDTEWLVCPAVQRGFGPDDWYLTAEGQRMVLGEIRRLGDQINDVFAAAVPPRKEKADDDA